METILLEIVDILECINNDYDKEEIREKIKKLSKLIAKKYIEKVNAFMQKIESEKEYNKMIQVARGWWNE